MIIGTSGYFGSFLMLCLGIVSMLALCNCLLFLCLGGRWRKVAKVKIISKSGKKTRISLEELDAIDTVCDDPHDYCAYKCVVARNLYKIIFLICMLLLVSSVNQSPYIIVASMLIFTQVLVYLFYWHISYYSFFAMKSGFIYLCKFNFKKTVVQEVDISKVLSVEIRRGCYNYTILIMESADGTVSKLRYLSGVADFIKCLEVHNKRINFIIRPYAWQSSSFGNIHKVELEHAICKKITETV